MSLLSTEVNKRDESSDKLIESAFVFVTSMLDTKNVQEMVQPNLESMLRWIILPSLKAKNSDDFLDNSYEFARAEVEMDRDSRLKSAMDCQTKLCLKFGKE